ncbi:MAG: hypothetical protein MUF64_06990 [Polyangiaceae bacterium]|nr:hypothetical protein [Polyangiaceae bacterium]
MLLRRAGWACFALLAASCCQSSSPLTTSSPAASVASVDLSPPPPPSRCDAPAEGATVSLGEEPHNDDSDSMPFAVEVGQGTSFGDGFALGALMPDKRGARAAVVTLGADGGGSKIIPLLVAHGDTPPPRVASAGKAILAGLLESGPSSRRLRLARVEAGAVAWGPEFEQARDESLAFDLVVHEGVAAAVWDDETRDAEHGLIKIATFDPQSFQKASAPRVISPRGADAEMPRIVPRPGGFWLTWVARRPESTDDSAREVGEAPEFRWLEAMPLDLRGAPVGPAARVTPDKGHLLTYDVRALPDGKAIVLYRDDDTPSGSAGGILLRVVLRPGGASEPEVVADRHLGIGAPALLDGWIAVADASAETRLARLDPDGLLRDRLESEPVLGRGEPVAALGDALLVLQPRGKGVRLFLTRCRDQAPAPPPGDEAPDRPPAPAAPASGSARPRR